MKKKTGRGGKGHRAKHAGTHKHHAHGAKHHPQRPVQVSGHFGGGGGSGAAVHTKAKHPHHHRGLAAGDLLPVCSFEAVAASLRVLGQRVSDDDVLALWDLCGQREVSIAEALAGAARFGLAGCRPLAFGVRQPPVEVGIEAVGVGDELIACVAPAGKHALILGVDLPGPHAVLATPDGWWSWGELYDPSYFPHARIEEAWAVSWS